MTTQAPLHRVVTLPGVDPRATLRFVRMGSADPTCKVSGGVLWKAWRTPAGPVTLCVEMRTYELRALAWGEGAAWALDHLEALAGLHDDPSPLVARDAVVAKLMLATRGMRLPRLPWVTEFLWTLVLQQRVAWRDAMSSWRQIVNQLGEPAPGSERAELPRLRVAPPAASWTRMDPSAFRAYEVDERRARTLVEVAAHAQRLDTLSRAPLSEARAYLEKIPGIGPWTLGMMMGFGLGDPDAIPLGDLHMPRDVTAALSGEPDGTEARMLALLAPYAGQRFRVIRMIVNRG